LLSFVDFVGLVFVWWVLLWWVGVLR